MYLLHTYIHIKKNDHSVSFRVLTSSLPLTSDPAQVACFCSKRPLRVPSVMCGSDLIPCICN